MSFGITFDGREPLPPGIYGAVVDSADLTDTRYGEMILFEFTLPKHGAKVPGWANPSSHPKSNAYLWSTTLSPSTKDNVRWDPKGVEGRECLLKLDIYVDSEGREKNKIVRVLPTEEE